MMELRDNKPTATTVSKIMRERVITSAKPFFAQIGGAWYGLDVIFMGILASVGRVSIGAVHSLYVFTMSFF